MSNTNREETKMEKSEAAKNYEETIRIAMRAIQKVNSSGQLPSLDIFSPVTGKLEQHIEEAEQYLRDRLAEVLQAQDAIDHMKSKTLFGQTDHYLAEVTAKA